MANVEKTVSILFLGDDQLSKKIKSIQHNIDGFSDSAQKITEPLASIAKDVLAVDAAINTLIAGSLALAVSKSGEFGDGFKEVSTLINASASDIGEFRADILDYSKDSVKSIKDINAAVYTAISAGTDYRESLGLLAEAEQLAIASKAELEPTVKLLASTMNAYGASTDEAQKYSDAFFQTVKLGQTTLPELSDSLAQVSNIAASAEVPIETLLAGIATLTAGGMDTAQAITALKGAISAIISPTSEAVTAADELGIEFNATALKIKGLEGVLKDVMDATDGNIESVSSLFGNIRGLSGVLGLASNDSEKFIETLEAMENSTGSTAEAYDKMAENFRLTNQKLLNNIDIVLIEIGDKLTGKYGEVVNSIAEVFKTIDIDDKAFEPIWAMLNKFGDDLIFMFNNIRDNLPGALEIINIEPLIDSYSNLGTKIKEAIQAIFGEIDLSTPEGLADVIDRVINTMGALNNVTAGIIEGMKPFLKLIGEGIEKFSELDTSAAEVTGNILGFATGLNEVLKHSKAITAFFATLAGASLVNAGASITALSAGLSSIALPAGIGVAIGLLTVKLIEELAPAMSGAIDYFDNLAASIFGYQTATEKAAKAQAVFDNKLNSLESSLKDIDKGIDQLNKDLDKAFESALQGVPDFNEFQQQLKDFAAANKEYMYKDGAVIRIKYQEELDRAAHEETIKKLEAVTKEKKIEVDLQKEKIKADADIITESLEWKAKVDIADIEATAKEIESTFGSMNTSIESTGDNLFKFWNIISNGNLDFVEQSRLEAQLNKEEEIRQKNFDLQEKLINQQILLNEKKLQSIDRGDPTILVDGTGLKPHLEAIMFELFESIKIKAVESGAEFLGLFNA